ncbi:MAG: flagellar basal-body rod protein FlgF [Phenylobacterium sp.]|uniref:flagellar basal-body rod protein FlgF n=1 Tax=Phenylobacterium sp. TaxID=1871053 RepID=UPI0025D26DB0|nr:flagellar basal-body rod protein FlgF [Phenylobacterium sp.]MBA4011288.1 flagellar basal-body rod protein FlgF [Phenylobacterium sp.]
MDNALYVGLSRQMTLRRELDIVANNIANMDTTGFKVENLMVETEPMAPAHTFGAPRPVKFVIDRSVGRDFGQGVLRATGAPFDLGIQGDGFFRVRTADGEQFTRDGRFHMDESGRLVTEDGAALLDEGGGEIAIDPKLGPVLIAKDGTVSQGAERLGKVGMARFDELSVLEKVGENRYRNTSNAQPQPATEAVIQQGMLEGSNVKPVAEITRMIEITRTYESVAKMMDANAELSRRSIERMGKVN